MTAILGKLCWGVTFGVCGALCSTYTPPRWTSRRFDIPTATVNNNNNNNNNNEVLTAPSRDSSLASLTSGPLDVLIIGGGSVGCGTALDASSRGLRVGLIEMNDYASGTSSKSTKLIHGGIRYLEKAVFQLDMAQLQLVAEALRERSIMIHQAPYLCHALPTLIPCYHLMDLAMYWLGAKLYDLIAAVNLGTLAYSKYKFSYDVMKEYPALKKEKDNCILIGGVEYYDGQFNDSRVALMAAMTASTYYNASVLNYAKAEKIELVEVNGVKMVKTTVFDRVGQKRFDVLSKSVVNAGGPFSEQIEALIENKNKSVTMLPSSGTHIIVKRQYCPKNGAMVVPSKDGRVVFGIPWLDGCLLGTTDKPCAVTERPLPTESEIQFLLDNMSTYVGKIPRDDVQSAWTGIRPLACPTKESNSTENVVREHFVTVDEKTRVINVVGGKWTTYRKIAQDVVDTLEKTLLKDIRFRPCCTESILLLGAHRLHAIAGYLSKDSPVPLDVHRFWLDNYGDRYDELIKIIRENQNKLNKIHPDMPITQADVEYCVKYEQCEHVEDFLARRTRVCFVNEKIAQEMIPQVAELMGKIKGWNGKQIADETAAGYHAMQSYRASV